MKKQFAVLVLGFGLLTTMSASYAFGQDDSMPDKKDAKTPDQTQPTPDQSNPDKMAPGMGGGGMKPDKTKPETTKPDTATPDQSNPDKMGSGKMGSGTMGTGSTPHNHGDHKKHKKGHKMPDGTTPPDKTPEASH